MKQITPQDLPSNPVFLKLYQTIIYRAETKVCCVASAQIHLTGGSIRGKE